MKDFILPKKETNQLRMDTNYTKTVNYSRNLMIYGLPLLFVLIAFLIIKSSVFKTNPNLISFGVTFDLLISIPFIYYLLIRKTKISNASTSIVLTLNLILAAFLIPKQNQIYLDLFKN